MFLKKRDGACAITLANGQILTRGSLPPPDTSRWVASRKAVVVAAVTHGLLSMPEALERYALTEEEFDSWRTGMEAHGIASLKITKIHRHRQL